MHANPQSRTLDRCARGRAQAVAHLLGLPSAEIEAEVARMSEQGVTPDVTLDWLVLESVR